MLAERLREVVDDDHAALAAACEPGASLCTIVGIEGSFSRRLGAQMAVLSDGSTIGDLADGCLERQVACDVSTCTVPRVKRYGRGSEKIDFRLPCGGGLDILLDPAPDRTEIAGALQDLRLRRPTQIEIACGDHRTLRSYIPSLKIVVAGEGPEVEAMASLCRVMRIDAEVRRKGDLALGRAPNDVSYDPWTACLVLFHDHEWELSLLEQAIGSDAFFVGAQGGEKARADRTLELAARGISEEKIAQLVSPVGVISSCKSPRTLALSALTQIVDRYEQTRADP